MVATHRSHCHGISQVTTASFRRVSGTSTSFYPCCLCTWTKTPMHNKAPWWEHGQSRKRGHLLAHMWGRMYANNAHRPVIYSFFTAVSINSYLTVAQLCLGDCPRMRHEPGLHCCFLVAFRRCDFKKAHGLVGKKSLYSCLRLLLPISKKKEQEDISPLQQLDFPSRLDT